ncbi:MAG: N-acetyltransferase family protein [Acidimicrobiales bacterium]
MTIRDAVPSDLAEIAALIHELALYEKAPDEAVFTLDDLDANVFGPDPVAEVLIAERADGGVAGMALYFRTYSTWVGRSGIWIEDLFVRPEFRGEGHGRALLDAVRARTDGRVEWVVLDWNEPAIGFYRSIGAEPVDGWTRFRWQPEG